MIDTCTLGTLGAKAVTGRAIRRCELEIKPGQIVVKLVTVGVVAHAREAREDATPEKSNQPATSPSTTIVW